jgi:hypothetical protein
LEPSTGSLSEDTKLKISSTPAMSDLQFQKLMNSYEIILKDSPSSSLSKLNHTTFNLTSNFKKTVLQGNNGEVDFSIKTQSKNSKETIFTISEPFLVLELSNKTKTEIISISPLMAHVNVNTKYTIRGLNFNFEEIDIKFVQNGVSTIVIGQFVDDKTVEVETSFKSVGNVQVEMSFGESKIFDPVPENITIFGFLIFFIKKKNYLPIFK